MAKGKFESGRGAARSAGRSDPYAVRNKPAKKPESRLSKLWPILAAVGGVAVLVVGILIFTRNNRIHIPETTVAPPSTVELLGMPRAELEKRFRELDGAVREDLTLTLKPTAEVEGVTEDPIVLTVSQADSGAHLDLTDRKSVV